MLALSIIVLLVALIILRVPVSFAIFGAATIGLIALGGIELAVATMETSPFAAVRSNSLSAVPLFILMAQLMLMSGLLDSVFDAAKALVGRIPGGTAIASIGAGTAFAAVSGSSTAAAATLAQTSSTRMIDEGYHKGTATGLVAVVGTLAAMIPPSIILVFYAITAEAPVGDVLVAGFFPGLVVAIGLVLVMYIGFLKDRSRPRRGEPVPFKEKGMQLLKSSPLLLIFLAVVGSIFTGIATPTEAAALGVLAALILVIVKGRWDTKKFGETVLETVKTTGMIFAIIMSAHVLGHFLTETRVTPKLVSAIGESSLHPLVVMVLIGAVYLILGFFMDQIAIIALTDCAGDPAHRRISRLRSDLVWYLHRAAG